jgi:hypothetical protein
LSIFVVKLKQVFFIGMIKGKFQKLFIPFIAALIFLFVFFIFLERGVQEVAQEVAGVKYASAGTPISWDGGGDGVSWEDGDNWSSDTVPGATSDVTIDSTVTVDIAGTTTIESLVLGNVGGTTSPVLNFNYDALTTGALIINGGDLTVHTGADVTHTVGTTVVVGTVYIDVQSGNATITGTMNADGKGYTLLNGSGAGSDRGSYGSGAGHGGQGGDTYDLNAGGGDVYGSITTPVTIGSGGGQNGASGGGTGGGAIRLDVSTNLVLNGSITVDGGNGTTSNAGGGAGGSILLAVAGQLSGTGTVTADGGNGVNTLSGGGGGGRIAISYATQTDTRTYQAYGGGVSSVDFTGGAGTIYINDTTAATTELIIDNNDSVVGVSDYYAAGMTPITPSGTPLTLNLTTLTIRNEGNLDLNSDTTINATTLTWNDSGIVTDRGGTMSPISGAGSLTIPSGATLYADTARTWSSVANSGTISHSQNSTAATYRIDITTTGDFTNTGTIDTDGLGYLGYEGPGAGLDRGSYGSGAGHGGLGGTTSHANGGEGSAYDFGGVCTPGVDCDSASPTTIGSGSGINQNTTSTRQYLGGHGGGAIELTVGGNLIVDGAISASGSVGSNFGSGGGSGGSVWLNVTGTLSSTGNVSADGGDALVANAGAGAGGRVRIACSSSSWTGLISVVTGTTGFAADGGTTSTACVVNDMPTVASITASQDATQEGEVSITFDINDPDDDDTVEALVEYNVGSGWEKATLSTDGADTSADFGDPSINNGATYQVGNAGAYILTSSGLNTVTTRWTVNSDEGALDLSTAQIRVTPYDGIVAGTAVTSGNFSIDTTPPTPASATYLDVDGNGTIDRVDLVFNENLGALTYDASDWSFAVAGDANFDDTGATISTNTVQVSVSADASETGSATTPSIVYTNVAGRLTDAFLNPAATFGGGVNISDTAAPLILLISPADADTGVDQDTDVIVDFTEAMNLGSITYTISDEPTGSSTALSNGDTRLTISHTGDYTSGSHTFTLTAADASAGAPASFTGAVTGVTHPATFQVSAPSGSTTPTVSNNAIVINNGNSCVVVDDISLLLSASHATHYQVSQDPEFLNVGDWIPFKPNVDNDVAKGPDHFIIHQMKIPFETSGDSDQIVYARFQNISKSVSSRVEDGIFVDLNYGCQPNEPTEEALPSHEEARNPRTGAIEPISQVFEGDLIQGSTYSGIYLIGDGLTRHPFINMLSFFTYESNLSIVKIVTDATLSILRLGKTVAPQQGRALIKFESDSRIFAIYKNPNDSYKPLLREIPEELLVDMVGTGWESFILTLDDVFYSRFLVSNPLVEGEAFDTSMLIPIYELEELEETVDPSF